MIKPLRYNEKNPQDKFILDFLETQAADLSFTEFTKNAQQFYILAIQNAGSVLQPLPEENQSEGPYYIDEPDLTDDHDDLLAAFDAF